MAKRVSRDLPEGRRPRPSSGRLAFPHLPHTPEAVGQWEMWDGPKAIALRCVPTSSATGSAEAAGGEPFEEAAGTTVACTTTGSCELR